MDWSSGRRRWVVAAVCALLALGACSIACWRSAAPPSPTEFLAELQRRHGIELDRGRKDSDWTFDRIATEWGGLELMRKDLPGGNTRTSLLIRGWECNLCTPGEVVSGAWVLGTGTIAIGYGSTLTGKNPNGGYECTQESGIEDGPTTFLVVAVPVGVIERVRFRIY